MEGLREIVSVLRLQMVRWSMTQCHGPVAETCTSCRYDHVYSMSLSPSILSSLKADTLDLHLHAQTFWVRGVKTQIFPCYLRQPNVESIGAFNPIIGNLAYFALKRSRKHDIHATLSLTTSPAQRLGSAVPPVA
jgi:hypothetical protein